MKKFLFILLGFVTLTAFAQHEEKAFIRLVMPARENNAVRSSTQYISGATCKNCNLSINGEDVKVYATGAFAYELQLRPGGNAITLVAESKGGGKATKKINYQYALPSLDTVKTFTITSIETFPEGDLVVSPGDRIKIRVKALPGCRAIANNNIPLYEMPVSAETPVPGIYQGEYTIRETDSFSMSRIPVTIMNASGNSYTRRCDSKITMIDSTGSNMIITKGRLSHLLFGLGDDRLGGAKIGYVDSLIPLKVTGKVGSLYKVRLSKYRSAYIPAEETDPLPRGSLTPESLTANWRVYGDSVADYLQLGLFSRLPYQSIQLINPSRIAVDIFGATNNTNWIIQMDNTKEIKNVYYEQVEDEVFRVTIELKHAQHWGHQIYYKDNNLIVKVRRQPESLELRNLRIAIDAGHGGGNTGTYGPTGSSEKEIALAVSLKLRQALRLQGAKVLMTRTTETFVDNKERILMYRDSLPDLLVSIHLNSSNDPIHVGGASTYYRYVGFRNLSHDIYKRMLELGLKEAGNTGSFNFMLNSPTEYPNALVEMLFLSNPEDEMLIIDEEFQQKMADKILAGIKDFLEACRKDALQN
jgi:N-acetylmuramoyl-L-alanine amidase